MSERTSRVIENGVAWVEMDDGKVNALSAELIGEIRADLDAAEKVGAVVVLRGRPGIFSAGFDLKTFQRGAEAGRAMVIAGAELVLRLLAFPLPVLTVCTGHAYPAGAFLMLASDVRFALAGEWRIGMNEVAIGMTVPRFALELARHRLTPPGFARVSTGGMFGLEDAQRFGYIDRIVAPGELEAAVREEAARLRALDMPSYAATKDRMLEPARTAIRDALDAER